MIARVDAGAPVILRLVRALDTGLSRAALYIAAALLAAMAVATMWQVLARFVFHVPQAWSEVLVRTLMIWTAFLALATAYHKGVMVAVDILHRLVPARVRLALECVVLAANVTVLATGFWFGIQMAKRVSPQIIAGLDVSIAWGYAAIPTGFAIALISVVRLFVDRLCAGPAAAAAPEAG